MKNIEQFIISKDASINILIPEVDQKFNYFYPVSSSLNQFDEVSVNLILHKQETELTLEMIGFIVDRLKNRLMGNLNNENQLSLNIEVGTLGKCYNIDAYQQWSFPDILHVDQCNYANFWLFSAKIVQTWMYTRNGIIYLEVSPSYPSMYSSPILPGENDFKKFMEHYKPILVAEINRQIAEQWIEKCDVLIDQLNIGK